MQLERSIEVSKQRNITLAQLERSLRAVARQGMTVKSITHYPDGRVMIAMLEILDERIEVNEWDS